MSLLSTFPEEGRCDAAPNNLKIQAEREWLRTFTQEALLSPDSLDPLCHG